MWTSFLNCWTRNRWFNFQRRRPQKIVELEGKPDWYNSKWKHGINIAMMQCIGSLGEKSGVTTSNFVVLSEPLWAFSILAASIQNYLLNRQNFFVTTVTAVKRKKNISNTSGWLHYTLCLRTLYNLVTVTVTWAQDTQVTASKRSNLSISDTGYINSDLLFNGNHINCNKERKDIPAYEWPY